MTVIEGYNPAVRRRAWTRIGVLCGAVVCLAALPPAKDDWIRVESAHFTLVSNASPRQTATLAGGLEQLRSVLGAISSGMQVDAPLPTRVYVFKNGKSFEPYKLDKDGKPRNVGGYFVHTLDGNYVAVDGSLDNHALPVIYHEYVHQWLQTNVPDIPLWFNEGLAEFYSSFVVRGSTAEVGRPVERHLAWLSQHETIPLEALFRMDTDSPDYNEGERQGTFYAQSWLLTHYLLADDPARRERVNRFVKRIKTEEDPRKAFEQAFETDLPAAQKALEKYARQSSFGFYRLALEDFEIPDSATRELSRKEVLFFLGDLLAHAPPVQYEAAREHLQAALEIDEAYAAAHATLGFLENLEGSPELAATHFRRAIELAPDDARPCWLYGDSLLQRFSETMSDDAELPPGTPPLMLEAREQFGRSLALAPDHAPSLIGFGRTFLFDEDPSPAVDPLSRGYRAMPGRSDVLLDLIIVSARSGNAAAGRSLLERALRVRGDADLVRVGEAAVAHAEIGDAIDLFNEGLIEDAEAQLRRTLEQTRDPGVRSTVQAQLLRLRDADAAGEEIDLYNRAVAAYNAGQIEDALALLEQLVATSQTADLRQAATERIAELQRTQRFRSQIERYNRAIDLANAGERKQAIALLEELAGETLDPRIATDVVDTLADLRR